MQLEEALGLIEKNLEDVNKEFGFQKTKKQGESSVTFRGKNGLYRVVIDEKHDLMLLECAGEDKGEETEFATISKSLFELGPAELRDVRSSCNEVGDELRSLYGSVRKKDLDKIKLPKAVSRTKAKNGIISYDVNSLANRFGTLYPELKDQIKQNIADYGEFLPEDFFVNYGTPKVLDVIDNGTKEEQKKLFKMLNEIYEDGTNEVQDIIGVTILGAMRGDKKRLEVADQYMTEYMAGPVHEINKITAKNGRMVRRLLNPPPYKPKKKRKNPYQLALEGQNAANKR